jgi:type II secretory pathway predicted ATPase ExeA/cell division septation protein DedD
MAHLVYGIEQAEDIILITGGIGTGKTLAVNSLLVQIQRVLEPVLVNVTRLTFRELLKYILLELGELVPAQPDTPDLLQQLKRVLHERRQQGRKVLLIVDEAQHLDADTLESLRLLINLSTPEEQCLQLVLVGQHALEETIGRQELAQLNQRIRVRYRIEPLSRQEVEAYLDHRVRIAGCTRHLFRPGAIDRIYTLSHGIPRVVNILASRALLAAFVAGKAMVEPSHVRADDLPPVTDAPHLSPLSPVLPVEPIREAAPATPVAPKAPPKTSIKAPPPAPVVPPAPKPVPAPAVASSPPPPPPASPTVEETVEEDQRPYLMWPPRHEEPRTRGKAWLAIVVPLLLAAVAVVVWQWPNIAGPLQTPPVYTAVRPVPSRPAVETPASDPSRVSREPSMPVDTVTVAAPQPVAESPTPALVREKPIAKPPVEAAPEPKAEPVSAPARTGDLAVHVGSFHDAARADRLMQRLAGAGFAAYETRDTVDGAPWVRVYAGPYATPAMAEQARDRLTGDGIVAYARVITVGE